MTELRDEVPEDREPIRALHRAAFGGEGEGRLVDRLREDGLVVVSLVAVEAGEVVGHALFAELPIEPDGGGVLHGVALAPLAVLPARQRRGIGSALVRRGLALCRERGRALAVVVGDPAYYGRFGFSAELARRLRAPWAGPFMTALELAPGSLPPGMATARYPDAFGLVD
jgi:putative acetyltransferase